ncbi:hypothetical protein SARC_07233 [Sphaeroforma arctica JP610]|uniref:AB hydrolase-1 domain-containing protein n=1 Tax=Sphaeroforma arctica JP610 TaxID=667725 RepID=A0A0L0FUQ6_9EUKA|nr:hypothetical protein SARC_07233 [Sphaeroforma arctica JP610]KNC80404.1 hypothetical protein SARC_07233 [Sphaeroforma arctica JP610]|eukprot:XP_014154306.1 hypothetical protein SARC_07233 [Sphaeroforma arctica JP610]
METKKVGNTANSGSDIPLVLYFHGNAGNLGDRIYHIKRLFKESRCHIFVLSYRGYGHSGGRASGRGLAIDAKAALEFIQRNASELLYCHEASATSPSTETSGVQVPVIVYGHSIGGAVGIHLASTDKSGAIIGLIVENTFTSLGDIVKFWYPRYTPYPFLTRFIRWPWHSEHQMASVTCPILFMSGEKDEMIPAFMMHRLCAAATSANDKVFVSIPNGLHNDTWSRPGYWAGMGGFIKDIMVDTGKKYAHERSKC